MPASDSLGQLNMTKALIDVIMSEVKKESEKKEDKE